MGADETCWMSAVELIESYRGGELSPVEVAEAVLDRVEAVNPSINAVVTVTRDVALEAARDAEEAYRNGTAGPLAGVPVTIKDLIQTKGIRTTFASKLYEDFVPDEDAVSVERIRQAGGVIIGKTNTPEFGLVAVTDNVLFGPARNPWDTAKTTGGSSGGAAGGLAAGFGPLALGSDGGGSIRVPSHMCGVFGLKPHFGRVPVYPHVVHGWETMSCEGPMARTVADAALLLDVIAGPDDRDRSSLPDAGVRYSDAAGRGVKGLKVAFTTGLNAPAVDPEVAAITGRAARAFEELGCDVAEDDPGLPAMDGDLTTLVILETAVAHEEHLDEAKELMYPLYKPFLDLADVFTGKDMVRVGFHREDAWGKLAPFFERYDLLLSPTVICPAFDIGEGGMLGPESVAGVEVSPASYIAYTFPFNFSGQPAASVPCGFTGDGLPVGLQVVGRRYDEPTVIAAAAAFEEARPWADRRPGL